MLPAPLFFQEELSGPLVSGLGSALSLNTPLARLSPDVILKRSALSSSGCEAAPNIKRLTVIISTVNSLRTRGQS